MLYADTPLATIQQRACALAQRAVNAVKIDRSFIAAMLQEERAMQIADAIVQLAGRLDIDTIAEGIETQEQARVMRDLGATMGPGNF